MIRAKALPVAISTILLTSARVGNWASWPVYEFRLSSYSRELRLR